MHTEKEITFVCLQEIADGMYVFSFYRGNPFKTTFLVQLKYLYSYKIGLFYSFPCEDQVPLVFCLLNVQRNIRAIELAVVINPKEARICTDHIVANIAAHGEYDTGQKKVNPYG